MLSDTESDSCFCNIYLNCCRRCLLILGGGVFRKKLDQEAVEEFLSDVESRTGWSMAHTIQLLREQWEEDVD